jgi:hypothetical protein
VLAVAAVSVPLTLGTPSAVEAGGPAVLTAPPTVWPATSAPVAALSHQQLADLRKQGARHLLVRAPQLFPDTTHIRVLDDDGFVGWFADPIVTGAHQGYTAALDVTAAGKSLEVGVSVTRPIGRPAQLSLAHLCPGRNPGCTKIVLPSGEVLLVTHDKLTVTPRRGTTDEVREESAEVTDLRPDGTEVWAVSEADPDAPAGRLASTAVLRQRATDPAFRLTGPPAG